MNLLKLKQLSSKNKIIFTFLLSFLFFIFVFLNRSSFFQRFDPNVVTNYLRSQDIEDTENLIKDRIFISDSDIYIASGYLYVKGEDPRSYNFQHPPFVKYLFGLSAKYLGFPLMPQIIFAGLLIIGVFVLGIKVFKNPLVGFAASILLMFDPVFKEVTTYALLDLGQTVFIVWFLIVTFYYPKLHILEGILLGLGLASKFYTPTLLFVAIIYIYKFLIKKEKINVKIIFLILFSAFLVFCFTYLASFVKSNGLFNIFFWQAKIIKFMLNHNITSNWGEVLKMFFGGYLFWPVMFIINIYLIFKTKIKDTKFLVYLFPIVYLIIFTFQLPFTRYFILMLPFLYLTLGELIFKKNK